MNRATLDQSSTRLLPVFATITIATMLSACGGGQSTDLQNPGLSWPAATAVTGHRGASALRPEHTLAA
ncbi:MAG: hypothetical protein WKG03_20515, partial [Telluria sp.]